MECICGFSAGSRKALDRHIARFAGDAATASRHAPTARTSHMLLLKDKYTASDKNGDRQLDFVEMSSLLLKGDPTLTTTELRRLFEEVDTTHDGFIDFDEFVDYIFAKPADGECGDAAKHTSPKNSIPVRDSRPMPPPIQSESTSQLGARTRAEGAFEDRSPLSRGSLGSSSCMDSCGSSSPARPIGAASGPPVRLLLVRHAQSANKEKGRLAKAKGSSSKDPELSEKGYEQAEALGVRLARDFAQAKGRGLIIASSPMRRCLLTIRPAVHRLGIRKEDCICQGAAYEYGCAGMAYMGSTTQEVKANFPEFTINGFSESGQWDYRGHNDKENEEDAKARSWRVVSWIWQVVEVLRQFGSTRRNTPTLVFSTHQTMADLLCFQLVSGSDAEWAYGDLTHKLNNTALTEIILKADGTATFGKRNDDGHLQGRNAPLVGRSPASKGSTPAAVTKKIVDLRAHFAQHDNNDDRRLDFHEMSAILKACSNHKISDEDLWRVFTEADTDMDGDVDFDEFVEYVFKTHGEFDENLLLSWSPQYFRGEKID